MSGSFNKHAKLSPSGAERWATCTASTAFVDKLRADKKIPEKEADNVYSYAGTFAHDIAERALRYLTGKSDEKLDLETFYEEHNNIEVQRAWVAEQDLYKLDPEDLLTHMQKENDFNYVAKYVDYCMSRMKSNKDRMTVEAIVPLFYSDNKDDTGTCDDIIEHHDGSFSVIDLKWRRSGMVESEENPQLMTYFMSYVQGRVDVGLMSEPDGSTPVMLTTYNPLASPCVDPWETTYGTIKELCKGIQRSYDIVTNGEATMFVPSLKACAWCPASLNKKCPAQNARIALAFPRNLNVDDNSDEELLNFCKLYPEIKNFYDKAMELFKERADRGEEAKGTKLVRGRAGNRIVNDEEKAIEFLLGKELDESDLYSKKIKTATQMSNLLKGEDKKEFLEEHTSRPEGKLVLAFEDDKRPPLSSVKSGLFKGINKG